MNSKKTMTKNDIDNLSHLPDVWFEEIDVWPAVKRTYYSLGRLQERGYVERKLETNNQIHNFMYRKIKNYEQ